MEDLNELHPRAESPRETYQRSPAASQRDPNVVVMPRVMFNYIVIGVTFLMLGVVIGVLGYDRLAQSSTAQNAALINAAVGTALAQLPAGVLPPTPRPTLDPNVRYTIDEGGNPAIGPVGAPITLIEFGDFRCSFCKRFNDETLRPLLDAYEGQIRFVYRDYPILGPDSLQAALAAECADDQGAFWPFHDRLYANPGNLTREAFLQYAAELGFDMDVFTSCYDEGVHEPEVMADYNAGQSLGVVSGTPTFFLNGKLIVGAQPYQVFVNAIEAELAAIASGDDAA